MKKKLLLISVIGIMLLTACSDKESKDNKEEDTTEVTTEATTEEIKERAKVEFKDEDGNVLLNEDDILSADAVMVQDTTGVKNNLVRIQFTEEGKTKFAKATADNVGKVIRIYVDDECISEPKVACEVTDGRADISYVETLEEAQKIADKIMGK